MEIFWIAHSCFKIKTAKGKVIYLDPYDISEESPEKADIIIASHDHSDHFDMKSIKNAWKSNTILIGPISIANRLKQFNGKGLKIGESLKLDDISITLVPSYNISSTFHPKSKEYAGVIIETEGKKIFHAGDTDRIPEMKNLKDITVAMLPCGGTYTMDFEEAILAAIDINPKIVLPMHNWDKSLNYFKELMVKKNPKIVVEILENKSLKL